MKTAISIPDPVFKAAESLARRLGVSRSELYSKAINEFLNAHKDQGVTEILNRVYSEQGSKLDDGIYSLQIKSIDRDEW
jgi:metal-responsive CopG/Arc/MetJ family transcriptional regulator